MGLDVFLYHNGKSIEINSKKYEDHYFKIGYFRSSYNEGGINQILENAIGKDLYWIFNQEKEEYSPEINWKEAKNRCQQVIDEFSEIPDWKVIKLGTELVFNDPTENPILSKGDALDFFRRVHTKHKEDLQKWKRRDYSYSAMNDGVHYDNFSAKPLKVIGIVNGVAKPLFGPDIALPTPYLIIKSDNSSYRQALEIVMETIEYVLSQDQPEDYRFHWSG